jgi:hypothetical protein
MEATAELTLALDANTADARVVLVAVGVRALARRACCAVVMLVVVVMVMVMVLHRRGGWRCSYLPKRSPSHSHTVIINH